MKMRLAIQIKKQQVRFCLLSERFNLVVGTEHALYQLLQLGCHQLTAQTLEVVGVDNTIKMVKLVLHDTCKEAINPFVMLLEVLVKI